MKTKKYKCFVVEDDEEVRVVKKNSFRVNFMTVARDESG